MLPLVGVPGKSAMLDPVLGRGDAGDVHRTFGDFEREMPLNLPRKTGADAPISLLCADDRPEMRLKSGGGVLGSRVAVIL